MIRAGVRTLLVVGIALAGPMMLGVDLAAYHFLMGTQPAEVRDLMATTLTPLAWWVVPLPAVGGILGFLWYPKRWAKSRERWARDPSMSKETAEERADLEALFLSTTLAQLPACSGTSPSCWVRRRRRRYAPPRFR